MKIWDWFRGFFTRPVRDGPIDFETYRDDSSVQIAIGAYAMLTVIEMIAGLISKCEVRTYWNGEERHGLEWTSLNTRPNKNQNAPEFWRELIFRLLFQNEVLVIETGDGQKIIAQAYSKETFALMPPIFSSVSREGMTFNRTFSGDDVLYLRYSAAGKQFLLDDLFAMYVGMITSASKKYQESDGEKGILNISSVARNDTKFKEDFKQLMGTYFKSYFENKNAVLPLYDGYTYQKTNTAGQYQNSVSDIKVLTGEAIARAAQAFQVPAALVTGDVAGIADAYDVLLTNCIDPLARMISTELTGKMFTSREIAAGCSIEMDTSAIKHTDLIDNASNIDKLIGSGWSHNEVRHALGQHRINEKWADEHYITKNYQTMDEALNGGEDNA